MTQTPLTMTLSRRARALERRPNPTASARLPTITMERTQRLLSSERIELLEQLLRSRCSPELMLEEGERSDTNVVWSEAGAVEVESIDGEGQSLGREDQSTDDELVEYVESWAFEPSLKGSFRVMTSEDDRTKMSLITGAENPALPKECREEENEEDDACCNYHGPFANDICF
mmetsp:Transcript_8416/g.18199  ORF Transcript_8416/g.18199 Transcript_8416/m.18199 type:complete len:173 (-) Transcript_8416:135-653(-)|eukprot:CAMPEP_0172563828 /NCGR_PEP_ID=MMETSP1067-20121228/102003_1 /TAXON_ID=265564 ORGANISM="Thalassiosira punctigera, Strain Tpunct2005C2" /NCGR_SAMPLE_ID=MMETSP1067 /ASSEMBLY_ACC=CAM_ASM_000444 /LENGTH=172 /DNA_ID=CAMNT_0013354353 /DNA_START=40 /DNA_END=558 /DNA_ORIENTATION=-